MKANSATGKPNPPDPDEVAILERFWDILRSPEPGALEAAQDLLKGHGIRLSRASQLADEDWTVNFSEVGGDAGVFDLGPQEAVHPRRADRSSGYFDGSPLEATRQFTSVEWVVWSTDPTRGYYDVTINFYLNGQAGRALEILHRAVGIRQSGVRRLGGGSAVGIQLGSLHTARAYAVREAWRVATYLKSVMYEPGITATKVVRVVRQHNPIPVDPTVNPASEDTLKDNPAWVTKHLADSWVTLESQVPAQWLPKLDRTASKGKRMSAEIPEYGCGAYGCVMPTSDPKIVLKLTTDDTEAEFAARLSKELPVPIVTKYEIVLNLPMAQRQGRKVYLLWREAADDVGNVDKVVGAAAEDAIDKQHKAAQRAFKALMQGDRAERELAAWTAAVKGMGKVPELKWLADGLLRAYHEKGIFFGDMHAGNLGRVRGQWVITDPGHVAVVSHQAPRSPHP